MPGREGSSTLFINSTSSQPRISGQQVSNIRSYTVKNYQRKKRLPNTRPTLKTESDHPTPNVAQEFTILERNSRMDLRFITSSNAAQDELSSYRQGQQNVGVKRRQAPEAEVMQSFETVQYRLLKGPNDQVDDHDEIDAETAPDHQQWLQTTGLTDYRAPSVRSYLDTSRIDPLQSGKIVLTTDMEKVLMHYLTVILPAVEPIVAEQEDFRAWFVPLTITEPTLLYSLIGCMSHDMEMSSVIGFGPSTRRNMVTLRVQYRIKAIQLLNECLAHPEWALKASTITAVHYLLWAEIFAGDDSVHLDGVQRLLALRGGFHGVQRKAMEGVMVGSFWKSVRTKTRPALPLVAEEIQMSDERFMEILSTCDPSTARIGEGFFDPVYREYFDEEMIKLLQDARRVWVCFEQIGILEFSSAEKRHFTIGRVNIDHRLLSYPFDHYDAYRPMQEACRQAVITFSMAHYNIIQPCSKISRCLVQDLKDALDATDLRSLWGTGHKMLLWALFLGAHISYGQRERPWFVTMLARVARMLQSRDWLRVRSLLVRFYYIDRVFQESFRKIWEEVELLNSMPE